jgi:GT2 family glycosyltransferase
MSDAALNVRHIDLANAQTDQAASDRAALTVYWWGALPLGVQLSSAAELPQTPATLEQLRVRFAAEQRAARDPALHAPLLAGSEGRPEQALTMAEAQKTDGWLAWLKTNAAPANNAADDLAVIVCTRDRGEQLAICLDAILAQNSPPGELIVVDNSGDGNAAAICRRFPRATYVREPRAGLSHARNAGVLAATRPLIAFTDDDVSPHATWTAEIMRAFTVSDAEAVTGLVLPIRLETPAQRYFQINMGGFGERFQPVLFNDHFFNITGASGAHVWRIGAGANMAFRRSVFDRVGLFDPRLGAGASGCSEDSEVWYRILATGGSCFYEPRAVVFHDHRSDWAGLERQMRAYMRGHVSALIAQADMFDHRGNLARVFGQLPRHFVRTMLDSILDGAPVRRRILRQEVLGWLTGLGYLFDGAWRYARPATPAPLASETPR